MVLVFIIAAGAYWLPRLFAGGPAIERIILISIDTCRADYVGAYGYTGPTTPNIDALAAEATLFENTLSPVPLTLPAHSTMLTGTIPPFHGVHHNIDYRLADSNVTLAEILGANGFETGAIVSAFVLDAAFGLAQGFDTYNDDFEEEYFALNISERRATEATRFALDWLETRQEEKSFLFLHYYDPHYAYVPPEPFASKLEGNLYAGEIAYTDHCIGKIVDKLKELDLYDSTLIIVTGDHGEMLGEHGETTHGYYIYQSAIKVPLVIKLPGTHSARRVESLVGLVDLVPTICSLLGIEIPPDVQGEDLSAFLYGKATDETDRYIYCESMGPLVHGANSLLGIVDNRYKYIQTTRPELYDLVNDPGETKNLFESEYNRARIMQDALAQMIEQSARIDADDSKITLDRETLRRLESLGYTGGGGTDSFEFDQSRTDPKDLIAFAMLCEQGSMLGHKKKYDEAIAAFTEAIAMQPDHAKTYHSRAQIYLFTGDFEKVAMDLGKAIELNPDFTEAHNELGLLNVASGRHDQALGHFNRAIELDPGNAETYNHRGLIYFGKGDFAQAAADFSKSIEISPDDAQVYANRGWLSFRQGWIYRALDDLDQAILLDPQQVNAYTYRGMTLLSKGDFDRAFADFEQAILLNPQHAKAYEGRAFVYLRKGNRDLAIQNLMKYAELDPKNPAARRSLGQVLLAAGRVAEAVENYKSALQLQADWPDLLNALAWILATNKDPAIRDGSEAVRLAERACELENYQNPERILTLAAAHAEAGDFVEAIEAAEKAAQLTESARKRALHSQTLEHLELYRNGQPFRK